MLSSWIKRARGWLSVLLSLRGTAPVPRRWLRSWPRGCAATQLLGNGEWGAARVPSVIGSCTSRHGIMPPRRADPQRVELVAQPPRQHTSAIPHLLASPFLPLLILFQQELRARGGGENAVPQKPSVGSEHVPGADE